METKLDSLLNLMIDGTIDKEIFTNFFQDCKPIRQKPRH